MDLRTLRYVVAVADQLNFTAAARALNVSQPALSQQIRLLEQELGIALFTRSSKGVAVTPGGRLVVDQARRVIGTAAQLRAEVDAFRCARRGHLRIGVTQSFNILYFPPVLSAFLAAHRDIDVTVRELSNDRIVDGVATGTLDMGVAIGASDDGAVVTQPLYRDRLMLACPAGHRLAGLSSVPLVELEHETLALLTDDFLTRRELDLFLSLHGVVPRRIVSLNTFAAILGMVVAGSCVAVIPAWPDGSAPAGPVRLMPLRPSPAQRAINMILPPDGTRTPAANALCDLLRTHSGGAQAV